MFDDYEELVLTDAELRGDASASAWLTNVNIKFTRIGNICTMSYSDALVNGSYLGDSIWLSATGGAGFPIALMPVDSRPQSIIVVHNSDIIWGSIEGDTGPTFWIKRYPNPSFGVNGGGLSGAYGSSITYHVAS